MKYAVINRPGYFAYKAIVKATSNSLKRAKAQMRRLKYVDASGVMRAPFCVAKVPDVTRKGDVFYSDRFPEVVA